MARRIEIGLLPACLHGNAPRTMIGAGSWKAISGKVRSAGKCVHCGSDERLHAHEEYRIEGDVIRLSGISCVCEACHDVIHMGRMFAIGRQERAIRRFMKLNGFSRARAEAEIRLAFEIWKGYPDSMFLDWSLLAERYGEFLSDEEREASLASRID